MAPLAEVIRVLCSVEFFLGANAPHKHNLPVWGLCQFLLWVDDSLLFYINPIHCKSEMTAGFGALQTYPLSLSARDCFFCVWVYTRL